MSLKSAFKTIINLQGRDMVFTRRATGGDTVETISAAPSNYFRYLNLPEEISLETIEIVVAKDDMGALVKPKRGDRVEDSEYGKLTVDAVIEMAVMGEVIGYRVRFR